MIKIPRILPLTPKIAVNIPNPPNKNGIKMLTS